MEIELPPLITLNETINGFPLTIEIRQEPQGSEIVSHVTLVQDDKAQVTYDMKFTACKEEVGSGEPRWQFISEVPKDLKDLEWTISEAIVEKDR